MQKKSFFQLLAIGILFTGNAYAENNARQPFEKSLEEYKQIAQEPGAVAFNPPEGWNLADPEALPAQVKIMVVGKGRHEFPPSINLSTETYEGTVKEYLKIVKEINQSQGSEWKDLGTIRTQAGDASLSQADAVTEWGSVRMMHVILSKNGTIYILTAAALKEEFPKFYKTFFESLRSLRINPEPTDIAKGNFEAHSKKIQNPNNLTH